MHPDIQRARAPAPTGGRRGAFFDLDRTLIPGSSLFLLARGLHRRRFFTTPDMVRFGWRQVRYRVARAESDGAMRRSRSAALEFVRGHHRSELEPLVEEICGERILPAIYPDVARLVASHHAAGDLTFVATAAPKKVADLVAGTLAMTGGIGTEAEVDAADRYSGNLVGSIVHGPAKADAVAATAIEAGIDLDASVAYSDSINDLPLLEVVGGRAVVNPDRKLRALAVSRAWPVHEVRRRHGRRVHGRR